MLTIFPNSVMLQAGNFFFQLLKDIMLLLFLEKSYALFHLCYKRSSFITTSLIDPNASPALDQEVDL